MTDHQAFCRTLDNGDVFFFAGSGVSYGSNMPSAGEILLRTARNFLPPGPTFSSLNERIVCRKRHGYHFRILPEVFYHILLEVTQEPTVLDIWRCLDSSLWASQGYEPEPNVNHLFIIDYSARAGLPVFTTNFDCLFEDAARALGYNPVVILPYTPREKEAIALFGSSSAAAGVIYIFKLHGTISLEGRPALDSLRTTASTISSVNFPVIELLRRLCESRHVVFCGYSGRDLDYFPLIRTFDSARAAFWMDRFADRITRENCESIRAMKINSWPDEVFGALRPNLVKPQQRPAPEVQQRVLDELEEYAARMVSVSHAEKVLICGMSLHASGYNRLAFELMTSNAAELSQGLPEETYSLYLLIYARVLDCISRYREAEAKASELMRRTRHGVAHERLDNRSRNRRLGYYVTALYQRANAVKQSAGPTLTYGDNTFDTRPLY